MNTSPSATTGKFDAGFGGGSSGANAMVVSGAVTSAVKDTTNGSGTPRSVLFLNLLKCSTC